MKTLHFYNRNIVELKVSLDVVVQGDNLPGRRVSFPDRPPSAAVLPQCRITERPNQRAGSAAAETGILKWRSGPCEHSKASWEMLIRADLSMLSNVSVLPFQVFRDQPTPPWQCLFFFFRRMVPFLFGHHPGSPSTSRTETLAQRRHGHVNPTVFTNVGHWSAPAAAHRLVILPIILQFSFKTKMFSLFRIICKLLINSYSLCWLKAKI